MAKKQFDLSEDLQIVLDALPFYVILVDETHCILFANKAVKKALNKNPEMIVGGYCPMVVHGQEKPIPECPLEDVVKEGRAIEKEFFDQQTNRWISSAVYPTGLKTTEGKTAYLHIVFDISERIIAEQKLKQSFKRIQIMLDESINTITKIVEERDPFTAGHQRKVSELAFNIAKEMHLPEEQAEGIRLAGLVHDIGKIIVPIEILCRPGKLDADQMKIVKKHSYFGYNILKEIEFPWPVALAVLQHHERLNGTGYPQGLTEKDIILEAKIISVADVVEAMSSFRPYRPALGIDKALEEISLYKGILYDPDVVDTCLKLFRTGFTFD